LNRPALLEEKPTADSQVAGAPPVGDVLKEFERMDPIQRQLILDELADRPELWSGEEALIL
jgi:hypothetical protein